MFKVFVPYDENYMKLLVLTGYQSIQVRKQLLLLSRKFDYGQI